MAEEPSNAASQVLREDFDVVNDRDFMSDGIYSDSWPGFTRVDKRRVVAQPPADAKGWVGGFVEFEELASSFPSCTLDRIVAVRGERLVTFAMTVDLGGAGALELLQIVRLDPSTEQMELMITFEAEQLDDAIASLDRLHAELTGG